MSTFTPAIRVSSTANFDAIIEEVNSELAFSGIRIETNTEYAPEYFHEIIERYAVIADIDVSGFVYGKGGYFLGHFSSF